MYLFMVATDQYTSSLVKSWLVNCYLIGYNAIPSNLPASVISPSVAHCVVGFFAVRRTIYPSATVRKPFFVIKARFVLLHFIVTHVRFYEGKQKASIPVCWIKDQFRLEFWVVYKIGDSLDAERPSFSASSATRLWFLCTRSLAQRLPSGGAFVPFRPRPILPRIHAQLFVCTYL